MAHVAADPKPRVTLNPQLVGLGASLSTGERPPQHISRAKCGLLGNPESGLLSVYGQRPLSFLKSGTSSLISECRLLLDRECGLLSPNGLFFQDEYITKPVRVDHLAQVLSR